MTCLHVYITTSYTLILLLAALRGKLRLCWILILLGDLDRRRRVAVLNESTSAMDSSPKFRMFLWVGLRT